MNGKSSSLSRILLNSKSNQISVNKNIMTKGTIVGTKVQFDDKTYRVVDIPLRRTNSKRIKNLKSSLIQILLNENKKDELKNFEKQY